MALTALRTEEPIPGYRVQERLGAGGYGEVWKADAPGGLQKAIKFVYGYLSDEKAARELKALNRIKQLRHPFLLSIERIEVVDGQLLIVTELADHSVKDRYQVCQKEGHTAIPREELLAYMRDAADALDYLCDNALQHLDIKPENLLIVGGRVKVADFGLVKEIQDRTYSLMGGMTPVYAAPEIFDGRPTSNSDQYSLAIVYQEMLTGVLPFPGMTAAQLATQHVNSKPRLDSLTPQDAAVIGQALAKNPLDRFANCRQMVDALHGTIPRSSLALGNGAGGPNGNTARDTTSIGGQETGPEVADANAAFVAAPRRSARKAPMAELPGQRHIDCRTQAIARAEPAPIIDLPTIEIRGDEAGLRPTLFVGIGGTGGHVMRQLRRRLIDRFGDLANVPVWQMMLVETDCHALRGQSGADGNDLSADETVMMPLRKPQEYRSETPEILEWLSRRWLYNIPRSLKTEGIRPLGRLALVDHAEDLFRRLRESISQIVSAEAMETSRANTGLRSRDPTPRVFVVASTSGGTGSGMALDVAYALRMLLVDMGLSDNGVCGILTHSTPRKSTGKDLATANTYALLNELFHYSRDHFPGEPACGLRAFGYGETTFPQAYFVHLGDHLDEHDFHHATAALASYLYLDAATAGGAFFDKCRAGTRCSLDPNELRLRTLGLSQLGRSQADFIAVAVEEVSKQVAEQWASGPRFAQNAFKSADEQAQQAIQAKLGELELSGPQLLKHFQTLIEHTVPPKKLSELTNEIMHEQAAVESADSRAALWAQLTQRARQVLGIVANPNLPSPTISLANFAADYIKQHSEQVAVQLIQIMHAGADDPNLGVTGAFKSGEQWISNLRRAEGELAAAIATAQQRAIQLGAMIDQPAATARAAKQRTEPITLPQAIHEYCCLLVQQRALEAGVRLIQSITGRLAAANDKLIQLRRDVVHLSSRFRSPEPAKDSEEPAHDEPDNPVEQALKRHMDARMDQIVKQVAQQIREECIAPAGGLVRLMTGTVQELDRVPAVLRSIARRTIAAALQEVDIGSLVLKAPAGDESASPIERIVQSAWPRMLDCGGGKRLLLVVPEGPSAEQVPAIIERQRQEKPTVISAVDGDFVACYECEDIALSSVIARLTTDNPSYREVGNRLHTRIDVEWTAI